MSMRVLSELKNNRLYLTLNRGEKGNCYDSEMIAEITSAFSNAKKAEAIILSGNGKHFCTGADLSWMARACEQTKEENYRDMEKIFHMYQAILKCPIPIISLVKGSVSGGGMGLLCASDFILGDQAATFSLPEKKWGLIPGIITPIVTERIGRDIFLKLSEEQQQIDAHEASKIGLIDHIANMDNSEKYISEWLEKNPRRNRYNEKIESELKHYLQLSAEKRQSGEFCEKVKRHFS